MPGGESCTEIRARFVPFIRRLIEKYEAQPQATVVLVGHGGTYRHALPAVLDNVSCEFAIQNGLGNAMYVEAQA
jgi:broad specificity phosphatase PhoE